MPIGLPVDSLAMTARKPAIFFLLACSAFGQSGYDTALKNLKFRSIGPAQMGGRIDDLAIVESDPRVIYVGAAAGGIFKTVNGGATWKAIFEDSPILRLAIWRWRPPIHPSFMWAPANPITGRAHRGATASIKPWTAA